MKKRTQYILDLQFSLHPLPQQIFSLNRHAVNHVFLCINKEKKSSNAIKLISIKLERVRKTVHVNALSIANKIAGLLCLSMVKYNYYKYINNCIFSNTMDTRPRKIRFDMKEHLILRNYLSMRSWLCVVRCPSRTLHFDKLFIHS